MVLCEILFGLSPRAQFSGWLGGRFGFKGEILQLSLNRAIALSHELLVVAIAGHRLAQGKQVLRPGSHQPGIGRRSRQRL